MDKTRTLPPLVRGKMTRILEFFVDKIKFFKNILFLTENFDLVLQVQWWGESLPTVIRPKKLQIEDKILKNSQSSEFHFHSERYEIRTTSALFQSYLKSCEVLELSILENVENCIIGSAFLRNLIDLLKSNNELISLPIFDYLGEEIGEVLMHINFLAEPQKKYELKQNENTQLFKYDNLVQKSKINCDILSDLEDNYLSIGEKTLFYNAHSSKRNHQEENSYRELQPQINQLDSTKSEKTINLDLFSANEIIKPFINQEVFKFSVAKNNSFNESLPNVKILNDSSKVLCFGLTSQQSRPKADIKNAKIKVPSKFSSTSVKCKSKSNFSSDQSWQEKNKILKTTASSRNFPKKQANLRNVKQNVTKVLLSEKSKESEVLQGYKQADAQSLLLKENSNKKVLDYLLGCNMSKNNEEKALNDFKRMSPSRDLVDIVSQLCLVSDNNSLTYGSRFDDKSSVYLNQAYLNFDFNHPIERDYYEKFFLESNICVDFKVAEFLNHPENSFKLGRSQFNEVQPQKESQINILETCSKFSLADEEIKKSQNEDNLVNAVSTDDKAKRCALCKYYKKVSELDKIIESLKHFEEKMIMHEKKSENSDVLIKRNQPAEGS